MSDKIQSLADRLALPSGRIRPASVGAVLTAVLTVVAATFGLLNLHHDHSESARKDALAAAKKHVPELLSYDYSSLDQQLKKSQKVITGAFKEQYVALVTKELGPVARKRQLVTRTQAVSSAVVRASGDEAVILMFLNQISADKKATTPTLSGSRVRVTLRRVDDSWRVSELTPL